MAGSRQFANFADVRAFSAMGVGRGSFAFASHRAYASESVRLRDDAFGRMFFSDFGGFVEAIEREIAARKLVRDFFTRRAHARQARASEADCRDRSAPRRDDV